MVQEGLNCWINSDQGWSVYVFRDLLFLPVCFTRLCTLHPRFCLLNVIQFNCPYPYPPEPRGLNEDFLGFPMIFLAEIAHCFRMFQTSSSVDPGCACRRRSRRAHARQAFCARCEVCCQKSGPRGPTKDDPQLGQQRWVKFGWT